MKLEEIDVQDPRQLGQFVKWALENSREKVGYCYVLGLETPPEEKTEDKNEEK